MSSRAMLSVLAALLATTVGHAATTATVAGISADPCRGVPVTPTEAHKVTSDWYGAWRGEWLSLDWGQLCRYRPENAALPPPTDRRVIYFGDSITEGWKSSMPEFFTGDVIDRGVGGQTTSQMLVRFRSDVIALRPAVVHIMAGTNDVAGNTGPTSFDTVQGNLQSMVELARANGIRVVLAAVPPADHFGWNPSLRPAETIRALNVRLAGYARQAGLVWVDYGAVIGDGRGGIRREFAEDGVHPTVAGYTAMAPLARSAVQRALAQPSP